MSFFDNDDYRINKFFMTAIGMWPYQSMKQRIFISCCCIFMVITFVLTMFIGALTCDEFDDTIKLIAPVLNGISGGGRFVLSIINLNRIKYLLERIELDWTLLSDKEYAILKQFSMRGRFLTVIYKGFSYGNLVVYFLNGASPKILNIVLPLNETRPLVRTYKSNYFVSEEKYYLQILLHEYAGTFTTLTILLTVDAMYAVFTEHACGMFAILRYRLENIIQSDERNFGIKNCLEENKRIVSVTSSCIILHQRSIEFASTLDAAYSNSQFLQTSLNIVSLSISGYMITLKLNKLDECLQFCGYSVVLLSMLLYSCIPGEKIQNYSQDAANSVFNSLWYKMTVKNQKHLMLMMVRSGRSCKLQAGKFFVLSLQFYTTCIQTSFSYLTLLLTTRKNQQ